MFSLGKKMWWWLGRGWTGALVIVLQHLSLPPKLYKAHPETLLDVPRSHV